MATEVESISSVDSSPGVLCKVCGDRASGKHYGVPSCDGCRGFFKRSIRRNLEYVCKEGGKCIVDVSRRNQCQACRFAKCLQANMRREAVQHERAPRACISSHSTLTMPMDYYSSRRFSQMQSNTIPALSMHLQLPVISPFESTLSPYFTATHGNILNSFAINHGTHHSHLVKPEPIISPLINNQLPISKIPNRVANDDEVTSTEESNKLNSYYLNIKAMNHPESIVREEFFETAAQLLFASVKWARSIPSFVQLPQRDQITLLEESWSEIFMIMVALNGLSLNSLQDNRTHRMQNIINQIILWRLDHTEAACLKALMLFRSDYPQLISPHQISVLQQQTLSLLLEKCGAIRTSHLLLILPSIKSAANPTMLQELLFKKIIGEVSIERLLVDLIKT